MIKFIYWFISLTWGCIMTFIGLISSLFLLIIGYRPYKVGYTFYFKVGRSWGGLTLGTVIIVSENHSPHTLKHEYGHTIQNLIFGPIELFIGIASASRYWYRELKYYRKNKQPSTTYDSIWFEGQATRLGNKYIRRS